ncbi:hypothetical protein D3C87_1406640 [compost metagenome]
MGGRQVQRDIGVGLSKVLQSRHEPKAGNAGGRVHVQTISDAVLQIVGGGGDGIQCGPHVHQVVLASRAKAHTVRATFKQAYVQLCFQLGNLMADRGRRQMQLCRRQRKTSAARDRFERLQVRDGRQGRHGDNPVLK